MVGLQLFGRRKDRDTQKGERWLKERRIPFHFVDLEIKPLSPGELEGVARAVGGFEKLIDESSAAYRAGGWAYKTFDPREELLAHPALVKTPILRLSPKAVVGFDETAWKELAGHS
jgi:arsenate reductase-like glutaredoxin family protein